MIQTINQCPIQNVLDKLRLPYKDLWNWTLWIFEDWKITNGRKANIRGNYINDFSGKNRARWSPFNLVKEYLNLTTQETFKWFETNYNIKNEKSFQKKSKVMRPYSRNN
jgi:hypothetical protein